MRRNFWTSFGQYMRPIAGADGDTVNWLNYKTGIKYLFFRMDVNQHEASIAVEMQHPDLTEQEIMFNKLVDLKPVFFEMVGPEWEWELLVNDEDGKRVSRIRTGLNDVNIFRTSDWPSIISFLKPRMIALDQFWSVTRDHF